MTRNRATKAKGNFSWNTRQSATRRAGFMPALDQCEARVLLDAAAVHVLPVAHDDVIDTDEGNAVTIPVLANDIAPLGFVNSSVKAASSPGHGTVTASDSDGSLSYNPAPGYFGTDTFTYTFSDTSGRSSSRGTVTIVVNRPRANDDSAATTQGGTVQLDVVANDTDPDGNNEIDHSSVAVQSGPAHGAVQVGGAGVVT